MTEWMGSLQLLSGLFGLCWWLLEMRYTGIDMELGGIRVPTPCSCAYPHCKGFAQQSREGDGSGTVFS